MTTRSQVFRFVTLISIVILALPLSGWISAADAADYTISGQVTDGDGNPVQGVTIIATAESEFQYSLFLPVVMNSSAQGLPSKTGFWAEPGLLRPGHAADAISVRASTTYTATTDANGDYTLSDLPAGVYTLVPSLAGQSFSPPTRIVTMPPDASSEDFEVNPTNHAPNTPSSPTPADGVTDQAINANLSWIGGDDDGDAVTYDVFFEAGDDTPDVMVCNDTASALCDPGTLSYNTQYYWQVVATDARSATTTGPVWSFTTEIKSASDLFDSVLYMSQVSAYTLIPHNESLALGQSETADFTIEAYFYVSDLDFDSPRPFVRKHNSFEVWFYFHNDEQDMISVEIPILQGTFFLNYSTDLQVGWHHIAIVFDNEYTESEDAVVTFLDGTRVAFSPDGSWVPDWASGLPPSSSDLSIGGIAAGNVGFPGYLEEIRISDNVRYSGLTYTLPSAPFTSDANTLALWHFDEPAGTTLFEDASSYGNDLTGYMGAQTYTP